MANRIIFMFSGQGSHYYQMGRELYEQEEVFRYWMQRADNIYQDITGLSVLDTLYNDNHKKTLPFKRTLLTHSAIFMIEYAMGQALIALGIYPDYVLGTSLGEFAASCFAGILSFEVALAAVIKQSTILEEHCPAGGMLAIVAAPKLYEESEFLQKNSELAAHNFHSHFIVSGKPHSLDEIETDLAITNTNYQRLSVSHGFHSSLIDAAAYEYEQFISKQPILTPTLPLISCALSKPLVSLLPKHYWDCVRLPIQFQKTIEKLEKENYYNYIDLGPSGTLATFVKYNLNAFSSSQTFPIMTPFGKDIKNLAKISEALVT